MKSTAILGRTTRTLGKAFLALTFLGLAIAVGFGGTALFVYHQMGETSGPAGTRGRTAFSDQTAGRPAGRSQARQTDALRIRPVAALPSDQSYFTYADSNRTAPSAPLGKSRPEPAGTRTTVPPPLETPALTENTPPVAPSGNAVESHPRLTDPSSRFITDSRTGRIIGVDGSAGAAAEDQQRQLREDQQAALQAPPPEVRAASPVVEDGQPVRRALPVSAEPSRPSFRVSDELASDDDRPVLRAQPVLPPGARVVKTLRVYRLPDGSQGTVSYY